MERATLVYGIRDDTNGELSLCKIIWFRRVGISLKLRSLVSELENGRLAMLAFGVQVISEIVTKKGIVEQWEEIMGLVPNLHLVSM